MFSVFVNIAKMIFKKNIIYKKKNVSFLNISPTTCTWIKEKKKGIISQH